MTINKKQVAYEYIKQQILSDELNSGDYLIQEELSKKLNISRTPVNQALISIEKEGLIELAHNKGFRLKKLSHDEIQQIYEARVLIEKKCIDILCKEKIGINQEMQILLKHMDQCKDGKEFLKYSLDFHNAIVKASNNHMLSNLFSNMYGVMARASMTLYTNLYNAIGNKITDHLFSKHQAIVTALRANDSDKAIQALEDYFFGYKES